MKKISKITIAVMLAVLAAFALSACGKGGEPKQTEVPILRNYDVAVLAKGIFDNCSFEDQYIAEVTDKDFVLNLHSIDPALVAEKNGEKQVVLYVSGAYPEMIFCAKAVDAASANSIMDAMKKVIDNYIENYTNYGPEQVAKLNNAVCRVVGEYVVVAVTNDNTAAAAYVDSALK